MELLQKTNVLNPILLKVVNKYQKIDNVLKVQYEDRIPPNEVPAHLKKHCPRLIILKRKVLGRDFSWIYGRLH